MEHGTSQRNALQRLNLSLGLGLFAVVALSASVWLASASGVTDRSDTLSNQTASQAASHTVRFILSGSNTFAAGESLVIDFGEDDAKFAVAGTTFSAADIDVDDGSVRTVYSVTNGAASCAGSVGTDDVAVGIDDTTGVMTFTACPSYVASAAGALVIIRLGEVAGGADRITNPSSGSHVITVTNAAGDCQAVSDDCRIAISIIAGPSVNVTAAVTATCGNAVVEGGEACDDGNVIGGDGCSATCQTEGGGGGPPPDTTPPVISNVRAENVTGSGADIKWDLNEASTGRVDYGLTVSYGSTVNQPAYLASHSLSVSGLANGTTYHYRVCSTDSALNQACSGDFTFTTVDSTPPIITSVLVSSITTTGATITWTTNEASDSKADYDTDGAPYASTSSSGTMVTSHSIVLTGLASNTLHHYRVRSGDVFANESFTADATFTTLSPPDSIAPAITNVLVSGVSATGATVTWTTNEASDSKVDYDTDGAPYASTTSDATQVLSHTIVLSGLTEGTTYHYRVRSADASLNEASTADATFVTADASVPVISNVLVSGVTPTSATVTWTTNEASDSKVDYDTDGAPYASTSSSGAMVTSHSVTLVGLAPNMLHHYRIRSADAGANEASTADATFLTATPAAPSISGIQVTNITTTGARVIWTTDTASSSRVDFGTTLAYGGTVSNGTLQTGHLGVLAGLTQGTVYHYRVRSTDAYAQETISGDGTFTTLADTTPPANVTGFSATAGDSQVSLAWTNPADPDLTGVLVLRKTTGFSSGPTDGTQVFDGTGTSFVDTGRTNGVAYYYTAFAHDVVPNHATGAIATATPVGAPDGTPPGAAQSLVATPGDSQVTLTWTNPTDPDLQGVRIVRKTGGCPADINDGTVVQDGPGTSRIDTGLTNGTSYCYAAFAFDAVPNYSSGVSVSATPVAPTDTTSPANVSNLVAVAGDSVVQVTWTNPADVDWAGTRLVRKAGSAPLSQTDGAIIQDSVLADYFDAGRTNGVTYYYGAFTYDLAGNFSNGAVVSATPLANLPPPPPPACSDSDGGLNYSVQGTVSETFGVYQDSCSDAISVEEQSCSAGARVSTTHDCGAGMKCSGGACVVDTFVPTPSMCGNGICDGSENSISCSSDCPVTPTTPPIVEMEPTVEADLRLTYEDIQFYVTKGNLRLRLTEDNRITLYPRSAVRVYLPDASIRKPIISAYVTVAGSSYAMRETASYETTIVVPGQAGEHPLTLLVEYADATTDTLTYVVKVEPFSTVYETVGNVKIPLSGTRVSLYEEVGNGSFGLWDGAPYGQTNPRLTDENGSYGFIGESGTYKIRAELDGYRTKETLGFPVAGNIISRDVELIRLPPPPENIVDAVIGETTFVAKVAMQDFVEVVQNEFVEQRTEQVAPVAAAIAVANVATIASVTATAFPYLLYLYSLLAHPTQLIARRRRKKWGIVFNAITQAPIDLAIVRLLDADTGRIIRSAVTDKEGRYFFIVKEGKYRMIVSRAGSTYPSTYLKDRKETARFIDLYHDEPIVADAETVITANIPVDPIEKMKTPVRVIWEGIGRRFQRSVGIISILAMAAAAVITPRPFIIGMLVVNVLLYAIFRRLSVGKKPKNWGIVYDEESGKPLTNVVARIFETKYNKLLETQVTDNRGRYAFLVGSNVYYVTFEKPGYQKRQSSPVDLVKVQKEEEQVVAEDVTLARMGKDQSSTTAGTQEKPVTPTLLVSPSIAPPPSPPPPPPPAKVEAPKASGVSWEMQMLQQQAQTPEPAKPPEEPAVSLERKADDDLMLKETMEEELAESAVGSVAQSIPHTHEKNDLIPDDPAHEKTEWNERKRPKAPDPHQDVIDAIKGTMDDQDKQ